MIREGVEVELGVVFWLVVMMFMIDDIDFRYQHCVGMKARVVYDTALLTPSGSDAS